MHTQWDPNPACFWYFRVFWELYYSPSPQAVRVKLAPLHKTVAVYSTGNMQVGTLSCQVGESAMAVRTSEPGMFGGTLTAAVFTTPADMIRNEARDRGCVCSRRWILTSFWGKSDDLLIRKTGEGRETPSGDTVYDFIIICWLFSYTLKQNNARY